jgi:hypothetical protein
VPSCGAALLLAAAGAASESEPAAKRNPAQMDVAAITACMRANVVERGSVREIGLEAVDRAGNARTLRMKLFWKPAKDGAAARTLLRVVEPADSAGASYLAITRPEGDEVYVFVPALGRVQRVKGDQDGSMFGTDFTWSEVKQVQGLTEIGRTRRLADAKVRERASFVLETAGDTEPGGTSRIRSYVDQATCTLLRSEFFRGSDEPYKVLEAELSTLVSIDPWWLILGYSMENRRTGTTTRLEFSDVYLRETLPEELFDPASFHRVTP